MGRFKNAVINVFATLGIAGAVATSAYVVDPETFEAPAEMLPSYMMPGDNGCSGVYIGDDLVLTANHCVAGAYDKTAYDLMWVSARYDVALLRSKTPIENRVEADLSCAVPKMGDRVYSITYPRLQSGPRYPVRSEGVVATDPQRSLYIWEEFIALDMMAAPGSSGGAVYNERGQLAGLVVGGPNAFGSLTLMVPGHVICGLLGR